MIKLNKNGLLKGVEEFCGELYHRSDVQSQIEEGANITKIPAVRKYEIKKTLRSMKREKTPEKDGVNIILIILRMPEMSQHLLQNISPSASKSAEKLDNATSVVIHKKYT